MTEEHSADPLERITESLSGLGQVVGDSVSSAMEQQTETLRSLLDERLPRTPDPDDVEPGTPADDSHPRGGDTHRVSALDSMRDPYTAGWVEDFYRNLPEHEQRRQVRADFELARMIQGGARQIQKPIEINYPQQFDDAARYHIFEDPSLPRVRVVDSNGRERAMDTGESGYGQELVGAQYVSEMWEAARNMDSLVRDIRAIPMQDPTVYVPIDGDLPEMHHVSESTTENASNYTTSKTGSNRVTLTAKKFTIQQIWSGEMDEDSIIPFVPFLREKLNMSAAQYLGSAYYNGDTTNAGTGNINSDDADPADTKHFLAWDGIRHYWLVDESGQGKDMAAALDPKEINVARGKLNGGDDDVDALVKNINWGMNPRSLRIVCDWDTYMALLDSDKVTTVDKYGPSATIVTGELGSIYGIPIISPSYASKTEADGKASGTEANNTQGQLTLMNPNGFLGGVRRNTQLFFDRIQRTDQFLFELYTRRAFTRFGGNVAAGVYNITV